MKTLLTLLFAAVITLSFAGTSFPQGFLDKLKEKAEEKIDEAIDEGLEQSEESEEEATNEETTNEEESSSDEQSQDTAKDTEENEAPVIKPKEELKSYSKFDFVPGDKIILYDDFLQDVVGDFPARWNTNGSGEIMTTNLYPGNWFKITGEGWYIPELPQALPDNFTVQFDIIPQTKPEDGYYRDFSFCIYNGDPSDPNQGGAIPGVAGIKFNFDGNGHSWSNYDEGAYLINGSKAMQNLIENEVSKFSIWVQKQRIRVYMGEEKIFDVPKGMPANYVFNQIRFELADGRPMITNFRIAVGAPDMRNKLLTEGKLVTHGILFDVNSDKIKPESYGTLKEIANVLKENASVKVTIVGHTDSDGSDQSNLELSKKRAVSVKNSLSKEFGIEEGRMETNGKGESEPTDKNDTPQGKANNRRVEFIKL